MQPLTIVLGVTGLAALASARNAPRRWPGGGLVLAAMALGTVSGLLASLDVDAPLKATFRLGSTVVLAVAVVQARPRRVGGKRLEIGLDIAATAIAAGSTLVFATVTRLANDGSIELAGAAAAVVLGTAALTFTMNDGVATVAGRFLLAAAVLATVSNAAAALGHPLPLFAFALYGCLVVTCVHPSAAELGRSRPASDRGTELYPAALAAAALIATIGLTLFAPVRLSAAGTAAAIACAVVVDALVCIRLALTLRDRGFAREELAHRAAHDELTGLANRPLLADRLQHAIDRTRRGDATLAVLTVDLDRFKIVNDTWGHGAGDTVLLAVASRLTELVRPGDTVARVGGDEFVIVCEELDDVEDAIAIAERIVDALRHPISVTEHAVALSVCVGIAVHQEGSSTPDSLLRDAEAAMFLAKGSGPNRWELYDARLREQVQHRRDTEAALQGALERDELRLVYQPVVRLATRDVTGFEALVRWARPGHGLVGPDDFIGLAEESTLICEIGDWVLEQACRQIALWNSQHPDRAPLTISVNVSGRQLALPGFSDRLQRIITRTGVDPSTIVLEITETVIVRHAEPVVGQLEMAKRLGVRLAIDDFGTGYSALAYLRQFPVDIVKIDRVFMQELGALAPDATVIGAVIRLAQVLGQEVIAEGAETEQQMHALAELGCDYVQGFYFAPPLAQAQAEMLVRGRRDLASVRTALQRT